MQFPTTGIFYCVLRSLSEAFRTNCRSVSRTEGQRGADYTTSLEPIVYYQFQLDH